ncbi:hypothetical protein BN946_scf184704.g2 [Trametes cinnabarina]|uniref:Uncharacterized protein n=1 Tax=Pycnoporus cinnabarinus TaxID=5643 RepID=A0A060S841_PYCCI|nr:hypothetical protein BN946_scf184704.g2 [Trametes cinnabarina]
MPGRRSRSASTGNCQVVPIDGELPCSQPGYKENPRLCFAHRKEYGRLTAAYKATSEEAEALYTEVRVREVTVSPWDADAVEDALELARMCVEKIDKEIQERQQHHARFFVELDDGHEGWIEGLRRKRCIVENAASQMRQSRARQVEEDIWQSERDHFPSLSRQRTCAQAERESMSWTTLTDRRRSSTVQSYATVSNVLYGSSSSIPARRGGVRSLEGHLNCGHTTDQCFGPPQRCGLCCAVHHASFLAALDADNINISYCNELGEKVLRIKRLAPTWVFPSVEEVDKSIRTVERYIEALRDVAKSEANLVRFTGPHPDIKVPPATNIIVPPVRHESAKTLLRTLKNLRANLSRDTRSRASMIHNEFGYGRGQEGKLGAALLMGLVVGSMAAWFGMGSFASFVIGGAAVLVLS